MAVKICTTGGSCITCSDRSTQQILDAVKEAKAGLGFVCCNGGRSCVAVGHITTITEARKPADDDDDDRGWGGRDIDLSHPEIVILTGGR
jgi:hypothetical protein